MDECQKARLAQINEQHRGVFAVLTYDDLLARLKGVLRRIVPEQAAPNNLNACRKSHVMDLLDSLLASPARGQLPPHGT